MKILVRETGKTYETEILDINERDITADFFIKFFCDVEGIYETPDEEREMFDTEAEWTVESRQWFEELAEVLTRYKACMDGIRLCFLDRGIKPEEYSFNGRNLAVWEE